MGGSARDARAAALSRNARVLGDRSRGAPHWIRIASARGLLCGAAAGGCPGLQGHRDRRGDEVGAKDAERGSGYRRHRLRLTTAKGQETGRTPQFESPDHLMQGGIMLKRLVLVVLLLLSVRVQAVEYTDVYYNPNESGWGVFLVQSDTTQFLAFFIYGPDGKPTWYVAIITNDGTGNYTGSLFATTGTYFAAPWQGDVVSAAGTVSFKPTDAYHATLTYTVNGIGTVVKAVQRQTLTP